MAGGITHCAGLPPWPTFITFRTGCHGATDLPPVCMAAALHFDVSIPISGIQEMMHHVKETDVGLPA